MTSSGAAGRVISGLVVIVAAIVLGGVTLWKSSWQADRDFGVCGSAMQSADCVAVQRPVAVVPSQSGGDGYELDVQLGPHTTFFLTGLTREMAAELQGVRSMEVRYRKTHAVALIAPDGTPIEIPLSITHTFWMTVLGVVLFGLFGVALLVWGIVRAARRPRLLEYAY